MGYNFVKFTQVPPRRKNPYPVSMRVGELVDRCPCSASQRSQLKSQMNRLTRDGQEFSVHDDNERLVIRRDK